MREILFRGKRVDNGEWIYGIPFQEYSDFWGEWEWIIQTKHPLTNVPYMHLQIDRKTVGQFTGLTDKNGTKIFEGDIVQYYGTYALEVFIENGHTKTRWFDAVTNSECTELFFGHDEEALGEVEVIGNIHDNPELLEGA